MDKVPCKYKGCQRGPEKTVNLFTPKSRGGGQYTQYCSEDCYHADRCGKPLASKRQQGIHTVTKVCPQCHQHFEIPYKYRSRKYCSIPCSSRWNAAHGKNLAPKKPRTSSLIRPAKTRRSLLISA